VVLNGTIVGSLKCQVLPRNKFSARNFFEGEAVAAASAWSETDRQEVAALLLAGKSAALIGQLIGLNRNQVIGRLYRDRELHRLIGKKYSAVRIARDKKPGKRCCPAMLPLAAKPDSALPGMRQVPLLGLRSHECRFAVAEDHSVTGNHLFCGRPTTPNEMYCREHRAIASPGRRD
jgi:hypothetical protein